MAISQKAWRADKKAYADLKEGVSGLNSFYCPALSLTYARLPELQPKVLFVMGGKSAMFPPQKRQDVLAKTGIGDVGNGGLQADSVKEVVLPNQGHLLTFEDVFDCAEAIVGYLGSDGDEQSLQLRSSANLLGKLTRKWKEEIEKGLGHMGRKKERAKI